MSSTRATSLGRVASIALAATLFARTSWAQQAPASGDAANADSLFTEAKQLMASGDYASACPKLAESYRLDPGTGTLTALAVCHQHVGKVATAWSEFVEVASSAQRQGRADREAFARQQITALEPLLSRLTIQVPADVALIPNLQVRRDSVVVSQPAWGVPVPVDPGDHVIEATAPDREPWTGHITVDASSDKKEIAVPLLLDKQAPATPPVDQTPAPSPPPPGETPTERHTAFPMRPVGLVVGGAGVVSLALGSYFGVTAISKSSSAKQLCSASTPCGSETAISENNDAKSDALISDITVIAGIAAIGTGLFMFLAAPKDATPGESPPAAAWRLVPTFGRNGGALTLHAVF
jgi:hypothetical protein